jgi:hypothetical protein
MKKNGHQDSETKIDTMGGVQWGKEWPRGAAKDIDDKLDHFALSLDCNPTTSNATTYDTAILDSECTSNFLPAAAPRSDKQAAHVLLNMNMHNGTTIQSSTICNLLLTDMPPQARHANILPGLVHNSLISVGKLCDNECSVTFTQDQVTDSKNGKNVMYGSWDPKSRLWRVTYQLVQPYSWTGNQILQRPLNCRTLFNQQIFSNAFVGQNTTQAVMILNMVRTSRINPKLVAATQMFGQYDFNRAPMAPPGTRIIAPETPGRRITWAPHVQYGWYIGTALEHYRFYMVYITKTRSKRIVETVVPPHKNSLYHFHRHTIWQLRPQRISRKPYYTRSRRARFARSATSKLSPWSK